MIISSWYEEKKTGQERKQVVILGREIQASSTDTLFHLQLLDYQNHTTITVTAAESTGYLHERIFIIFAMSFNYKSRKIEIIIRKTTG